MIKNLKQFLPAMLLMYTLLQTALVVLLVNDVLPLAQADVVVEIVEEELDVDAASIASEVSHALSKSNGRLVSFLVVLQLPLVGLALANFMYVRSKTNDRTACS